MLSSVIQSDVKGSNRSASFCCKLALAVLVGATDCAMLTSLTSCAQGLVDFNLGTGLLDFLLLLVEDHGSRVT